MHEIAGEYFCDYCQSKMNATGDIHGSFSNTWTCSNQICGHWETEIGSYKLSGETPFAAECKCDGCLRNLELKGGKLWK